MSEHTSLSIKEKVEIYVLMHDDQFSLEEVLNKFNMHLSDWHEITHYVENLVGTSLKSKDKKSKNIKKLKKALMQKMFDWPNVVGGNKQRNYDQQVLFEIIEWTNSPSLSQHLACLVLTQNPAEKSSRRKFYNN